MPAVKNVFTTQIIKVLVWLGMVLGVTACSSLLVVKPVEVPTPTAVAAVSIPTATVTPSQTLQPPTRIVVPAINLDAPVVTMDWRTEIQGRQATSVWNVPENEAGWHLNSARPGQGGNVVISGHNNSMGGHVFGRLDDLAEGDAVTLWVGKTAHTYYISHRETVRTIAAGPEQLARLQQLTGPAPTEQLTLITCWPNWTNTHRLILVARPGEPDN